MLGTPALLEERNTACWTAPPTVTTMDPTLCLSNNGVWILDEEGDLKGMTMVADRETGDIIGLSSRNCRDDDKRHFMPSLKDHPELKFVDFHGQRYMRTLDESIGFPVKMERLLLTRMDSLEKLHPAIVNLSNLVEVRI